MPFDNWLRKLNKHSLDELSSDLIQFLSDKELLAHFEEVIDTIHNRGIGEDDYHGKSKRGRTSKRYTKYGGNNESW